MAQVNLSATDIQALIQQGDFTKFLDAMRHASEQHDFDSGWSKLPGDQSGSFKHGLTKLPHRVYVYAANSNNGDGYTDVSAKATVTKSDVSLPTNLGYTHYRILADR